MEKAMICPYCGQEMKDGAIPAYQRRLTWCPRSEYGGIAEGKGVLLSKEPIFEGVYAAAGYCEACGVVIVSVPDQEEVKSGMTKAFEKLSKRFDTWCDERDAQQEAREQQKAREKKEKERIERGKKDPWEV